MTKVELDWNALTWRDVLTIEEKSGMTIEEMQVALDPESGTPIPTIAGAVLAYVVTNKQTPLTWDEFIDQPLAGSMIDVEVVTEVDPTNAAD